MPRHRAPRAQGGSSSSSAAAGSAGMQSSSPRSTSDTPDISSDDSGSDFEKTLRLRGKRGSRQGPALPQASKRPRSREPGADGSSPEQTSLFEAVKSAKVAVETVVDEWLETYKQDQETGFLELANFIVRSCGCRGVVTPEMFRNLQNSEIIQQLTEKFEEDSAGYPLSLSTQLWRRFRAGFCELLAVLVQRCQYSIVYDEFLMDSLISLLIGLSDSQVRAFRHTSTLAAMKLMTALVNVALAVRRHQENNRRQFEAERGKDLGRRAAEKLEALLEKRRELQEQQEEMENMMNAIFKGVFVHRYRDVVPEIRAICMEELGTWMRSYTASFLTDSYLKYVGWTLHDKQREVRMQCVKALQGLYRNRDTAAHMELFTSRFKPRMVAMVLDKDTDVAVQAVKLLTLMLENMEEALTEEDCQSVYPMVYVSSRALASAAGLFLYRRLLDPRHEADEEATGSGDNRVFFRLLLTFFIESELHEHAAYLVDSLWDCAGPRLRDWDTVSAFLLEESPSEGLSDRQEKALVEILAASVVQAAEGEPPPGRVPSRKPSAQERKAQAKERSRLSHCLIPVLPQLLAKFSADAEKAAPLLETLRRCDLSVYCTGRLEKHLELLLAQLQEVVEKHTEPAVLEAASRALHALCDPELALHGRGDLARSRLADQLADKCRQDVAELLQAASLEEEELYSMAATLKRISILFNAHDLTPWQLFEPCAQLLQRAVDTGEVPSQVLVPTISCLAFHILWDLSHLPSTDVPEEPLRRLQTRAASFCSLCQSCLSDADAGVREQAFMALADLLVVLGPRLRRDGREALAPLELRPDTELQSLLAGFLLDHVFSPGGACDELEAADDSESRVCELNRRRVLLAAYCKLVLYGVLELHAASDVAKHYDKFYSDYGDIIKETLSSIRHIDPQKWAQILLLSLQQLMSELLLTQGPEIQATEGFLEIRDLARRFSLFFNLHPIQHRPELLHLHWEGLQFALGPPGQASAPQTLPFLEVLSEFSPRLLPPDRARLLLHLERLCRERWLRRGDPDSCPPVAVYRQSLHPPDKDEGGSLAPRGPRPRPPTATPAKRPRLHESPSSALPTPLPSPTLASTGLRRPGFSRSSSSVSLWHSRMSRLSLMVEEEEEEEEGGQEESSEGVPEQDKDRLCDLFDSTTLGIEDA
ncbi:cohesin subunit SA-3 [Phaenicophaeus curvirostris]|uniref:cohesin subunit SA-3 n=1 Tax=Phaenicophaeus curvirostris TaxID=33595 RepID=UPI0037F0E3F0